jgi:Ca2+-binding RTX toxin-like protein
MNATSAARRALVLSALVAAAVGYGADAATAAFTARVEGDTLEIRGDAASDKLILRLQAGEPSTLELDVGADGTADFTFDRSRFTAIDVRAGSGNDEIRRTGFFPDESLTIRGDGGADTLVGGIGDDVLHGGQGNDLVSGGDGNDRAFLGGGEDTFTWNPGDDNDIVEGQAGADRLDFNGANVAELIGVSAVGERVRFTRNIANIVMDLNGVEHVGFDAFGGADTVVVDNLRGTDAETVEVDLNANGGGGDGQPDAVVARGTDGQDRVVVSAAAGTAVVSGLGAEVRVRAAEAAHDSVDVATLGGQDTIRMSVGVDVPATVNVDGGDDIDIVRYSGTPAADAINAVSNGTEASVDAPATARLDATAVENLILLGLAGEDTFSAVGNLAPLTQLTMDGGEDDDILRGGNGADLLVGGGGDDFVDGNQGIDRALLGTGDDTFQWDPGDGNDTVEGQSGEDALDFNGSGAPEIVEVSANGERVRFTRNVANILMDLDGLERVSFRALGGADAVFVDDLHGTDVEDVGIDLDAIAGGGDGQPDAVTVRGTEGADRVSLSSPGGFVIVSGLGPEVVVESAEAANDDVNVETLGGDDTITTGREVHGPASINLDGGAGADVTRYYGTDTADAIDVVANGAEVSTVAPLAARLDTTAVESLVVLGLAGTDTITGTGNLAPLTQLTMEGGEDADILRGGNGADLLIGGEGNDVVDGNQGTDRALLGTGDDTFQWDPGDGNDTVEGQGDYDRLVFNGSNIGEAIDVSYNGGRVLLTRNIANIAMDLDDVEALSINARGGADTIGVGDLSRTNVESLDIDVGLFGAADGEADTIAVKGTSRGDDVEVTRAGSQIVAAGLRAEVRVVGSEAADTLLIQTLGGDDNVTVAPDVSSLITPIVDLDGGE